jgi:predicted RNase H-like nuclease
MAHARVRAPLIPPDVGHVVAIDQPLVVPNATGSREVDITIARAFMADYRLAAHAANTSNACFGPSAGIWQLLAALRAEGYLQDPAAVAARRYGRYVFECYPNAALIGWLGDRPRYKVRSKNAEAWHEVIEFLRGREDAELRIVNARRAIPRDLAHTKENEDRIDALIAAYSAAWLWRYGFERSVLIGDLEKGYVVTPVNAAMRACLAKSGAAPAA